MKLEINLLQLAISSTGIFTPENMIWGINTTGTNVMARSGLSTAADINSPSVTPAREINRRTKYMITRSPWTPWGESQLVIPSRIPHWIRLSIERINILERT